jgi:hypothetical protein
VGQCSLAALCDPSAAPMIVSGMANLTVARSKAFCYRFLDAWPLPNAGAPHAVPSVLPPRPRSDAVMSPGDQ